MKREKKERNCCIKSFDRQKISSGALARRAHLSSIKNQFRRTMEISFIAHGPLTANLETDQGELAINQELF